MSDFSKKWENFWFYYKVHVIVAIAVAIVAGITIYDKISYVEPDFFIDCFTDGTYIAYDTAEEMGKEIAQEEFFIDINNDGNKRVNINVFSAGAEDKTTGMQGGSAYELMDLKMAVGNSAIVFADKSVLKRYENKGILKDISFIAEKAGMSGDDVYVSADGTLVGIKIDNTEFLKKHKVSGKDLYMALRVAVPTVDKEMTDLAPSVAEYILK